jgi:hypothetical protein
MRELPLLGFLVHLDADGDAGDRTIALARQAAGADVEIHLENAAVAARQGFLDRTGILSGYWIVIGFRNRCEKVIDIPRKSISLYPRYP